MRGWISSQDWKERLWQWLQKGAFSAEPFLKKLISVSYTSGLRWCKITETWSRLVGLWSSDRWSTFPSSHYMHFAEKKKKKKIQSRTVVHAWACILLLSPWGFQRSPQLCFAVTDWGSDCLAGDAGRFKQRGHSQSLMHTPQSTHTHHTHHTHHRAPTQWS